MKLRTLAAAAFALSALLLAGGALAGAHGDAGLIEIEAAHPTSTGTHYIVRLTFENDGDPVADATVTATPIGPDGREQQPVPLAPYDDDGRYQAAIEMAEPGSWTVRFASADPEASAETTTEVTATTTSEGTATTDEGAGFAPADDGTGDSATTADSGDEDDDGFPVLIVVAAAVVAVGGLFAALRVIRRNSPGAGPATSAATPPTGDPDTTGDSGDATDTPAGSTGPTAEAAAGTTGLDADDTPAGTTGETAEAAPGTTGLDANDTPAGSTGPAGERPPTEGTGSAATPASPSGADGES